MGVELISEIVQKNGLDFPLLDSNNLRGGIYSVASKTLRDLIPDKRKKEGMICYVERDLKYYRWENKQWTQLKLSVNVSEYIGIPIYDQELWDLHKDDMPDKFISIPNKEKDLECSTFSREIQETGTYVDILFSALRKLQSEVARLRNSFKYGIYSYTDKNTAMSSINAEIKEPDEEPLWAIEETDLSKLDEIKIGLDNKLVPSENVNVTNEGKLIIRDTATWSAQELMDKITDPKMFIYITANKPTIKIHLDLGLAKTTLDLSTLNLPVVDLYDIMLIISREIDTNGKNFIWISVKNRANNLVLLEDYYLNISKEPINYDINYNIDKIDFTNLELHKCTIYSRYLDFTHSVIPSTPNDNDYKYSVAHITIRSVKSEDILKEIQNQLPNNELVWDESGKKLWIKSENKLFKIGSTGGSGPETGMDKAELINYLKEIGIVSGNNNDLHISNIADLTFIHLDTNQQFKFQVDSNGNLYSTKVDNNTIESRLASLNLKPTNDIRGIIGQLRIAEFRRDFPDIPYDKGSFAKIYSDRLKIGAFYAPYDNQKIFGCSHAFIELENTADCDFCLKGCYLHFTRPGKNPGELFVYHLPLTGTIKAGSTYLIRGKQYSNFNDNNTFIKVKTFDLEWYNNGELIDLTIDSSIDYENTDKLCGYGFALTYQNENLGFLTPLFTASNKDNLPTLGISADLLKTFPFIYDKSFIDAIYYKKAVQNASNANVWANLIFNPKENCICRNTFELDPAKQAFLSLNKADSSRNRWSNAKDILVLSLNKEYIEFPKTLEKCNVNLFTPKASFENKTVATDKTKLDMNKPNMVTCLFGIDIYKTRCFNWISAGNYDEFVWIKKEGDDIWHRFESYKTLDTISSVPEAAVPKEVITEDMFRKNFYTEYTSGDLTVLVDENSINNNVYARIVGRFPGDGTLYTSHKVIVNITKSNVMTPTKYTYIVGRSDKNGNPDKEHSSLEYTFTLYPDSYIPRIYQITDLQGFTWIEYLVWAAAALKVEEKIKLDSQSSHIIPILINTGDMTLNGTRVNEWLDYYKAGECLFKLYEQMNVVGNNDLCGTNVNILGTGDDIGKSNSFYFHIFYCYEIDPKLFIPIVNDKYIPSFYYFDSKSHRFLMVNSEITRKNCEEWFKTKDIDGNTINIYTGYTIGINKYNKSINGKPFITIYSMIYNIMNDAKSKGKKIIAACHEMPFTVITNESIKNTENNANKIAYRSLSPKDALIGSHLNQIDTDDTYGIYWFSRLLEYFKVPLCIGGHKHTYSCTYPLRENFKWQGGAKNSKDNISEYVMKPTLENDDAIWKDEITNYTKFPLTKRAEIMDVSSTYFYPYTPVENLQGGVIYFMCLATGNKYASNKELPSANQKFSLVLPETTITKKNENDPGKDTASKELKYPMFGIIDINSTITIKLARVVNIFTSDSKFDLFNYSKEPMKYQYLINNESDNFGTWLELEQNLLSI